MADTHTPLRTLRGIQHSFFGPMPTSVRSTIEVKGVVYTKRWVVELILDLAGYVSSSNLVDSIAVEPAAGDGAFLSLMVERLADSCFSLNRPITDCSNSLIAYEIDESSAKIARSIVTKALSRRGVARQAAEELAKGWVRRGDYLLEPLTANADFVIGNPPYVRIEDIPVETYLQYRNAYSTMRGRADLYVAFFEAALSQLSRKGTCAFICADRWMRNQYGMQLRELVTSNFALDIVIEMHRADAFKEEVDAYPAITIIRRRPQESVMVASLTSEAENLSPGAIVSALTRGAMDVSSTPRVGLTFNRSDKWFKGTNPWPCKNPEQVTLLRQLEEKFPLLESFSRVGIGVATGNDQIFITKDERLVEPSRLLKLALAKDISSGDLRWSGNYLVDPWNGPGLVRLSEYPKLREYLEGHRQKLQERHTARKNTGNWYKTIDRVTHSLTEKSKLYIADIKNSMEPVLDKGGTYPHHNLYFIESDAWNLEMLGGLLMSTIAHFFIESYGVRMRGGYYRFQAQYLRRIRVPDPRAIPLSLGSDLILAFRKRDRELASRVALTLYGITQGEAEIAIGS